MDVYRINRIYHRSPIQTEKSQSEGKRIMAETRFTVFPALSVDSRVGISWSTLDIIGKIDILKRRFTIMWYDDQLLMSFGHGFSLQSVKHVCKQLTSLLVSRVSCLSPTVRQSFSASLKIEQTLSHRSEKIFSPGR